MNIILGNPDPELDEKFVVLPLDTFLLPDIAEPVTAYCVVSEIPLTEFAGLEIYRQIHHKLVEAYRERNWDYCQSAIDSLLGKWNGALDSYYREIAARIQSLEHVDESWTHVIDKRTS